MTASELISEIEAVWGKEVTGKQAQIYCRKLERFSSWELECLLEKVLETCKYFPKLSEIWGAARELGFFRDAENQLRTTTEHTWVSSSCNLCGGEGRLHVWFKVYSQDGRWKKELTRIFQYCGSDGKAYQSADDEYSYLYRCSCDAGDAETLPEGWPKWKTREEIPF